MGRVHHRFQNPANACSRAQGDVAGIAATKYASTTYADLTTTFTTNGQTGFCNDCDPPSNPPKVCTSVRAKTGHTFIGSTERIMHLLKSLSLLKIPSDRDLLNG